MLAAAPHGSSSTDLEASAGCFRSARFPALDDQGMWELRVGLGLHGQHRRVDVMGKAGLAAGLARLDRCEAGVGRELVQPGVGQDREMLLPAEDEVFQAPADAAPVVGEADEPVGIPLGEFLDRDIAVGSADPEGPPGLGSGKARGSEKPGRGGARSRGASKRRQPWNRGTGGGASCRPRRHTSR